jgi:hypothetical protein
VLRVDMRALYPEPPGAAGFDCATFWVYCGNFETWPLPLAAPSSLAGGLSLPVACQSTVLLSLINEKISMPRKGVARAATYLAIR